MSAPRVLVVGAGPAGLSAAIERGLDLPDDECPGGERHRTPPPQLAVLGQFMATRPDVIGVEAATDLSRLKDALPPFPQAR